MSRDDRCRLHQKRDPSSRRRVPSAKLWISEVKMVVMSLVMVLQFSLFLATKAVNAGCDCIVFDDTYGKDFGVFTSPNWPVPYENNIDCLLYNFMGREQDIVEITFDEFDIQKKNIECIYGDFVKLFLHLPESAVNDQSSWNAVICGKIADIEQTHYSLGHSLIFEFHTDWQNGNNTGFRGTYRFLSKKIFEVDGEKLPGTGCDFQFVSGNRSHSRGRFYSPHYPSSYPQNSECVYHFMGKYNEHVKVTFEKVRLQAGDLSCLTSPDVILVHDGRDSSNTLIGHLCNINNYVEITSTTPDLFIEFISKSHFPGQGFKASYVFEDNADAVSVAEIPSTEPENNDRKQQTTSKSMSCEMVIDSDLTQNGSISSPGYPEAYPANVFCSFIFKGRGKERVQVLFTDLNLVLPDDIGRECEGVDSVTIFITINGQKERIDNFCGSKLPAQLMSNGPKMTIEFKSTSLIHSPSITASDGLGHSTSSSDFNSTNIKGFKAVYKFVTNFGITTGTQDNQSVCGFMYNSSQGANGSFTSPNWPGYYPRATECHYFFQGKPNQKVHITFVYFDVEGVTPCNSETASDYVEFSNFKTADWKIPRHCGLKKPKIIESEGSFFRVTFKSNDRFDGTGFEAFYQFRNVVDPVIIYKVQASANEIKGYHIFGLASILLILLINFL